MDNAFLDLVNQTETVQMTGFNKYITYLTSMHGHTA